MVLGAVVGAANAPADASAAPVTALAVRNFRRVVVIVAPNIDSL
uniref:Uncharacterized protein n=1 Tax=uncultured organism TaxID=155900 RepID=D8VN56_9ZZZZ|nr:hypothetical protein [uncultured organism]